MILSAAFSMASGSLHMSSHCRSEEERIFTGICWVVVIILFCVAYILGKIDNKARKKFYEDQDKT